MKRILGITFKMLLSLSSGFIPCLAQVDTIYLRPTFTNPLIEKIPCNIQSMINPRINYKDPLTSILDIAYFEDVKMVRFKSGSIQAINDPDGTNTVNFVEDWDKVLISPKINDTIGKTRTNEILIIGMDYSILSVKDRTYNMLKVITSMEGGSLAFITSYKKGTSLGENMEGPALRKPI